MPDFRWPLPAEESANASGDGQASLLGSQIDQLILLFAKIHQQI
jgi:hypothetical protein